MPGRHKVFLGMAADVMQSAARADSLEDLFLRMEDADVMLSAPLDAPGARAHLDALRSKHRARFGDRFADA